MDRWTVLWHPAAEKERDKAMPTKEIVAMRHAAEKLELLGPSLRHPHSSAVRGVDGQGLRELRPRGGRSRYRPIYRQVDGKTFVIFAVAPEAEIDKRGYAKSVKAAAQRFAELEL